ncbi:hypothetical protein BUQ74_04475 [Leptospira weilii serovar Heyan]|nr:hypothetical protein BUQ74_04475 [Leptospira weilii serovar Heyan]QDK21921.1 hypothetical protein FHG67_03580 [Leptospira weilii]QDK25860.1 hypothetical protein FHG68_03435 [Leptospira weilii]
MQSIPASPVLSYNTEVLHIFFGIFFATRESFNRNCFTNNYIIKYLIFDMESVFCGQIDGARFYRDRVVLLLERTNRIL